MSEVCHRIAEVTALFIFLTALRIVNAAEVYLSSHQVGNPRPIICANLLLLKRQEHLGYVFDLHDLEVIM